MRRLSVRIRSRVVFKIRRWVKADLENDNLNVSSINGL